MWSKLTRKRDREAHTRTISSVVMSETTHRGAQPLAGGYPAASGGVGVARKTGEAARWTGPSSPHKLKMASSFSKLAMVVMMLSALCCGVSSQGHVQETIGQTLQGESTVNRRAARLVGRGGRPGLRVRPFVFIFRHTCEGERCPLRARAFFFFFFFFGFPGQPRAVTGHRGHDTVLHDIGVRRLFLAFGSERCDMTCASLGSDFSRARRVGTAHG